MALPDWSVSGSRDRNPRQAQCGFNCLRYYNGSRRFEKEQSAADGDPGHPAADDYRMDGHQSQRKTKEERNSEKKKQ